MAGKKPRRGGRSGRGDRDNALKGGQIGIWGIHACREAIENPRRSIVSIALDREPPDWLTAALKTAEEAGVARPRPQTLSRVDLQALVPPQAVHQGIVVQIDPLPVPSLDEVIEQAGPSGFAEGWPSG